MQKALATLVKSRCDKMRGGPGRCKKRLRRLDTAADSYLRGHAFCACGSQSGKNRIVLPRKQGGEVVAACVSMVVYHGFCNQPCRQTKVRVVHASWN